MINKQEIHLLADKFCADSDLFVVGVEISPSNDIEVIVDSMERVCLNQCASLSKQMQEELDQMGNSDNGWNYSIVVASSGIGSNLRDFRQITKCVGQDVSVVMKDGVKIVGKLQSFDQNSSVLKVEFEEKVAVEGKKRKEITITTKEIFFDDTKTIIEELKIK